MTGVSRARIACAVSLLALISCSGSAGSSSQKTRVDPCSLVTKAEAERIFGSALGEASRKPAAGGGQLCSYAKQFGSGVQVTVYDKAKSADELRKETAPGNVVDGLGDAAYFFSLPKYLEVVRGKTYFSVGVYSNPGVGSLEKERALALIVLTHL
ncbi:MAG: hypothetical protein NVSMB57_05100 [Actinomycetota bacterium]